MKKTSLFILVSTLALAAAGAQAQPKPAAPAAAAAAPATPAPPTFGAAIPGQCILDTQTAMGTSAMGKAASERLVQLKAVVDGELQQQGQALDAEYKSLVAQQKTAAATPAGKSAWEAKAQAWSQKRDAFQAKVQQRQQEMQYTQQEVMSAIFQKMIPNINSVVTARSCSTVVTSDSLLHYDMTTTTNGQANQTSFVYVNPAMDITSAVVQKMDASGELLDPFQRVNLDQQAAAPAAQPAQPAAPRAVQPAAGAAPKK